MEQLMTEIEAYAKARGIEPGTVLQYAAGYSGTRWATWQSGGQCSMKAAEKIRAYMRDNPVNEAAE